ncbi:MAG: hypothetical protein ABI231_05015 [Candidatus Tumulicola sp.]
MTVHFSHFRRLRPAAVAMSAWLAVLAVPVLTTTAARAEGTARIQQADGAVTVYHSVTIQIVQKTLTVTSADGKGTMLIYRAACAYQGDILVCLPTGVSLVQSGSVSPIKLASGTVYANLTDDSHNLDRSSTRLPAHSILMSLKTRHGTYVNVNGTIDKEAK